MIGLYQRGEQVDIWQQETGGEVSPAGVTYRLDIERYDGSNVVPMVTNTLMTQVLAGRWFYRYSVPASAAYGTYNVRFTRTEGAVSAVVDNDEFMVWQGASIVREGVGLVTVTDSIINSVTLTPIQGATVEFWYRDASGSPTRLAATTTTNASGVFTVYLDAGTYLRIVDAAGYNRATAVYTVT